MKRAKNILYILLFAFFVVACKRNDDTFVAVKSVSLSHTELQLAQGYKFTLRAAVSPDNATNRAVTWSSDDPAIVSVDDHGWALGVSPGNTVVRVTARNGKKAAVCSVEVKAPVPTRVSMGGFESTIDMPFDKVFDRLRADISGVDWQIIGFVEAFYTNGIAAIELPETLPEDSLSKAYRDNTRDYAGFWPVGVSQITDPAARVAGLKEIIAYRGDERVGRIYLADRNKTFAYFHFTDRPFELSGYNLVHPSGDISYRYVASFAAGWNAYINIAGNNYTTCTTVISAGGDLRWKFEAWP